MLAKPGEESGLYKRQRIHVKTGIVTGAGGVLKKAPPRFVCARSSPKAKQHACSSVPGLVLQKAPELVLHVNKCMLYQPKKAWLISSNKLADSIFSQLYQPSFFVEIK